MQEDTYNSIDDVIAAFRSRTDSLFHSFDNMSAADVEALVTDYIAGKIEEYALDIEVLGVIVTGSRCRGLENDDSDIDVVVEYKGRMKEDALFNILHEDEFTIFDVAVDINPITEVESGSLVTYLPWAEEYLLEKAKGSYVIEQEELLPESRGR